MVADVGCRQVLRNPRAKNADFWMWPPCDNLSAPRSGPLSRNCESADRGSVYLLRQLQNDRWERERLSKIAHMYARSINARFGSEDIQAERVSFPAMPPVLCLTAHELKKLGIRCDPYALLPKAKSNWQGEIGPFFAQTTQHLHRTSGGRVTAATGMLRATRCSTRSWSALEVCLGCRYWPEPGSCDTHDLPSDWRICSQ